MARALTLDRYTFKRLASLRLREARTLLRNGQHEGAYYLCGYAVECALKACLAKQTKRYGFPPPPEDVRKYYTHDLEGLLARVGDPLASDMKNHPRWAVAKEWSEQGRYRVDTTREDAQRLYAAVTDRKDGVLKCIKKYW